MAGRSDIEAGRAHIKIFVKKSDFIKGLQQVGQTMKGWAIGIGKAAAVVGSFGAGVVSALAAAANSFAKSGDEINKMSERTGASTEALSELRYAAGQSGASLEDLEVAFKAIAKKGGTGDPAKKLEALADELASIKDPGMRAKKALDEMGKSGTKLLPLMINGAKGVRELRKEAQELGLTITKEQADKATAFGDAWDRVKAVVGAVVFNVGAAATPAFLNLFRIIENGTKIVNDWVRANERVFEVIEDITAVAAAGNWASIGKLIVATLNIAWAETAAFFTDTWEITKLGWLLIWQDAVSGLAKMLTDAWAGIQIGWEMMVAGMQSIWDGLQTGIMNGISEIRNQFASFLIELAGSPTISNWLGNKTPSREAIERMKGALPFKADQAARSAESANRQAEIEANRKAAIAGIGAAAGGANAILEAERKRKEQEAVQRTLDRIAKGEMSRAAARAELDKEMQAIRDEAAKIRKHEGKRFEFAGFGPSAGRQSAGTFSAAAALALGGGGPQERLIRSSEEIRKLIADQKEHIKELRANARKIAQGLRHN